MEQKQKTIIPVLYAHGYCDALIDVLKVLKDWNEVNSAAVRLKLVNTLSAKWDGWIVDDEN